MAGKLAQGDGWYGFTFDAGVWCDFVGEFGGV
jgi:hypothetical protein